MLHILHPPGYLAERHYIFDVLLGEFLGLDYVAEGYPGEDIRVGVIGDQAGRYLTLPDILFRVPQQSWLTEAALPVEPLSRWAIPRALEGAQAVERRLPVLYGRQGGEALLFEEGEAGAALGIDIFGSAFLLLTRYEEAVRPVRDSHDRFPARASLAWREGFLERPLVNEYLEVLWAAIQRLWPGLRRRPRAHRVYLSHDVDQPFCVAGRRPAAILRSLLADLALRRDAALGLRRLRAWAGAGRGCLDADPGNTFDLLMDMSEQHGRRSAFNFMACLQPGPMDGDYALEQPWVRRLMRRIHERGHEVGLHTSYRAYLDPALTRGEWRRLHRAAAGEGIEQAAWGGRQHYLRWRNPTTWESWSAAGLDYDSTLGFADHAGFRCGVCYEYPVFNLETRQPLKLRERPLVAMEGTLLSAMGLSWQAAHDRILGLNAVCKAFGGEFSLLWHNSNLISRQQQHWYNTIGRSL